MTAESKPARNIGKDRTPGRFRIGQRKFWQAARFVIYINFN
jgi:hypothetical protein